MIHISQDMYIPFVSSQWLSSHSLSFTKCHSVSVWEKLSTKNLLYLCLILSDSIYFPCKQIIKHTTRQAEICVQFYVQPLPLSWLSSVTDICAVSLLEVQNFYIYLTRLMSYTMQPQSNYFYIFILNSSCFFWMYYLKITPLLTSTRNLIQC
jgi:hypothetical protein